MIQRWTVVVMRKTRETWLVDAEYADDAEELALEKSGELQGEAELDAFVQRCEAEDDPADRHHDPEGVDQ